MLYVVLLLHSLSFALNYRGLLGDLQKKYGYNDVDALLVLKDILAQVWKSWKKK